MSERIDGVPEGYRLGKHLPNVESFLDSPHEAYELIPIQPEQPRLEAVIVVPVNEDGWYMPNLSDMMGDGLQPETAREFAAKYPDRVTIREKGAK